VKLSELVRRVHEVRCGIPLWVRVESYPAHLVLKLLPPESHGEDLFYLLFLLAVYNFAARLRRVLPE
jgi:hypothetical protein